MNKSLQGRFRGVMHNNYTLYYFVYMYTQICDVNNQYSYSYVKWAKQNSCCVAVSKVA